MTSQLRTIATVDLNNKKPTELSFDDLYTWVIWQFPRKRGSWLCGAVRPPIANHGWLPALIKQKENLVQVHGQVEQEFSTPNQALEWLISSKAR